MADYLVRATAADAQIRARIRIVRRQENKPRPRDQLLHLRKPVSPLIMRLLESIP